LRGLRAETRSAKVPAVRYARLATADGSLSFASIDGARARLLDRAPWDGGAPTGREVALADARLVCPVVPSKIIGIGRNYGAHAKELGNDVPPEPLMFLKPPSSLLDPGGAIVLPPESQRVEHEAELGVVIGRRARFVAEADALAHVFGYTCVGDITARDLQRKDGQWTRAKGFDTFCPVGPAIETDLDPAALEVVCRVNGATRQSGHTRDMIFPVATLVAYASRVMTLEPGDLVATGTPEGVGPLASGDRLEIEIPGIGVLALAVSSAR
jgi:2-keto-4-pentenoate hydratase/2-oxohepta-3-ene-1,7-dioic acid hydratase in catechol pathway